MNPLYYPSLGLCNKLTEDGFGKTEKCFCPNCFWTWKECCNNPDHSFFDMCRAWWVWDAYGCPCCGWKIVMKWECDFCKSWIINSDEFDDMEKLFDDTTIIFCPSVMELLDEMPIIINDDKQLYLVKHEDLNYSVKYWSKNWGSDFWTFNTLPNALAEMWLWLKEYNYLTK